MTLCQASGADNKGYGIIYNYIGSDNSNSFYISAAGFFTVNHYINSVFKDDIVWKKSDKIFKGLSKYNKLGIAKKRC